MLQALQTVSEVQLEQALGQSLQCLDGIVAKKYPSKQLHTPLVPLVAEATHCLHVVPLVQTAHPEAQAVHIPAASYNPLLHWQVWEGRAKNLLESAKHLIQMLVVRTV